jgi:tripartite-type tricarboxylate transporter receptor subunit TctC
MRRAAILVVALACGSAAAQDYPSRPMRIVLGSSPAGMVDTFTRVLAAHLSQRLGQPVTVENRVGASQIIAHEFVAKSEPDGHTLLQATQVGMVLLPGARKSLPYDPLKDFSYISMLFTSPFYMLVHPSLPVKSVEELVALARAQPGKLNYGTIGPGTMHHLGMELFALRTGIKLVHVPYKGSGPLMPDALSGQIQLMIQGPTSALPAARSGKLRAIGVTSPERTKAMPDVPTFIESGLPDFVVDAWFGLAAPARTPRPIIDRLNRETHVMLRSPETVEKFARSEIDLIPSTPEQMLERVQKEVPMWTKVMRAAGIEPQ